MQKNGFIEKAKGVIMGHAVADALGLPVQFTGRKVLAQNPVTQMQGFGAFSMPKGAWSDDTSMSVCALESFSGQKISMHKIMQNFCLWYFQGEFTPTGVAFDIGATCGNAIVRFFRDGHSCQTCGLAGERDNGNGSLMRIYPFVLYTYLLNTNVKTKIEIIEYASALTHAHPRAKMGCGIFAFLLWEFLSPTFRPKQISGAVMRGLANAQAYYKNHTEFAHYQRLFDNLAAVPEREIQSSGYVVHTLEAAVWCLLQTNTYRDCVVKAVNLGDDTDTVGAVAGALAGAVYGYEAIPKTWLNDLIKREYLEGLAERFLVLF